MILKLKNISLLLKNLKPIILSVIIFNLFVFSTLFQLSLAGIQTETSYDPQTNTYYPGCGTAYNNNKVYENVSMTPALFNWQMVQTPTIQLIRSIDFIDTLYGYITYYEGVMKTVNGGLNWQEVYFDQGDDINGINFVNKDTGWFCGSMSRIRKTINGGENWTTQDYPPFIGPYYNSVWFIDNNTGFITGSENAQRGYIIKTTNSGVNWQQIFLSTQNNTNIHGQFWFNKDTGWVYGNSIFMKTTNGGLTFQDYYPNLPPTSNGSNALLGLYFINAQTGWLSGSNVDHTNMHKTTNGGESWVFQDNPVTQYQFAQLDDVIFIDENRGWAGGYSGQIITTTNGGVIWITDITAATWFVCFAKYGSSKAWCGANNGEVWYIDEIPPISVNQNGTGIPVTFELKQNYPNPFNPSTTIKFFLPKAEFVTLKVYDAAGKEVAELVNGMKQQGNYAAEFNAVNLASGIYFYRLEAGEFSEVKKMALIK